MRGQAKPGDVVVDYDLLAGALSGPHSGDPHRHPEPVRTIAFRARTAAIREALLHVDTTDVYIIHSMPSADALARYTEHHAQLITIDPGRDVVMQRIAEQRPATARAVAARWYNQAGSMRQGTAGTPNPHPDAPTPHPLCTPPPRPSRSW